MSYAIITLGGKQYRVREGERLLVDRLAVEDGKSFTPSVLLVGGDGEPQLDPTGIVVTAKVLGQQRGPKIRIGKYKKRTGYRKHNGFRAALTQIEIESIGGTKARAVSAAKPEPQKPEPQKAEPKEKPEPKQAAEPIEQETGMAEGAGLPTGYTEMTVAAVKAAVGSWDAATITTALEHERAHGNRKGAIAALESALAENEG
jgi:large subunit ribosomal protein L21